MISPILAGCRRMNPVQYTPIVSLPLHLTSDNASAPPGSGPRRVPNTRTPPSISTTGEGVRRLSGYPSQGHFCLPWAYYSTAGS